MGSLAVYLLFSDAQRNSHYSNSWLEFVTVEISLALFVADLFTTLTFFPDAFIKDKGNLIHHVFGVAGLLISVYRLNAIAMFRLLSPLSVPFLLLRLFTGVWEEGYTSVSADVYCTDLGAFRVSDCNFSMALETLCLLCSDRGCNT